MTERTNSNGTRRRWGRWGFWTFVLVNVLGVVVAIPLLQAVGPLVRVWWNTRSQESFQRYQAKSMHASVAASTPASTKPADNLPNPASALPPSLEGLTNRLNLIGNLNQPELDKIVAHQFGGPKPSQADPTKFDRDSAVFHKITRSIATLQGVRYYCYEVDLVDPNGNHKVHVDCFEKPDLDYERSMAALELVNSNPQLKKIYQAFAHVLAEKSASPESSGADPAPAAKPVIRMEADPTPGGP